jgi:hypothetical protein
MTLPYPGTSAVSGHLLGRTYGSIRKTGQSFLRKRISELAAKPHYAAAIGHIWRSCKPAKLSTKCGNPASSFYTPETQVMYSAGCGVKSTKPCSISGTDKCSHVLPTSTMLPFGMYRNICYASFLPVGMPCSAFAAPPVIEISSGYYLRQTNGAYHGKKTTHHRNNACITLA